MRLAHDAVGSGEAVVFLHGVGSDRRTWAPQLAAFAPGHLAVAADCRGHGGSRAAAGSISMATFAADVAELIEELWAGPAHVCGLSMGALIGLQLWADRPDLVRSLVLAAGWAHHPAAAAGLDARLAAIDATSLPVLARQRMPAVLGPTAAPDLVERAVAAMAGKDPACYRRSNQVLWATDMRGVAPNVRVPTLVLVGELDTVTPPALSAELAALIPGARLEVLAGTGHLANEENPAAFNAALRRHLG